MPLPRDGSKKQLARGIQVVPNAAADVTTTDTFLRQLHITNVTASTATFTLKDKASTPRYVFNALNVEPNTAIIISWPTSLKLTGGMNWVAGTASAIQVAINGEYIP